MAHLHALYRALEQRGLEVRMAYAAGLDFRPAIERFFVERQAQHHWFGAAKTPRHPRRATVDVLVNGVGFALVGGMAASQPEEAVAALRA